MLGCGIFSRASASEDAALATSRADPEVAAFPGGAEERAAAVSRVAGAAASGDGDGRAAAAVLRVREPGLHLLKLCPFARGATGKPFVLAASSGGVSLWDAEGQPLPAEFALPEGAVVRALATKDRLAR